MVNFQTTVKRYKTSVLFYVVTGKVITVKNDKLELINIEELGHDSRRISAGAEVIRWSLSTGWKLNLLLKCRSSDIVNLDVCSGEYKILLTGDVNDPIVRGQLRDSLQLEGYEEI
jgi:hypothetical protein